MPTFEETQQEDFLTGWGLGDIIKADSRNDTLLGDEGSDLLWGNEGNDYINGKQNNDTIDAGHDNDSVHGGKEDDQVFGDRGNDIIYGDLGNDILFGGIGSKQPAGDRSDSGNLIGSHREKAFNSNEGSGSLVGKKGSDIVLGGKDDDKLLGETPKDILYNQLGRDTANGKIDGDIIFAAVGSDLTYGYEDNDTVNGGEGVDTVYDDTENDIIRGGKESDILFGDEGNALLFGDRGGDILTGGSGDDLFVIGRIDGVPGFFTTGGTNLSDADIISDFGQGFDLIGLDGGLAFQDLSIYQGSSEFANDTVIQDRVTGEYLAILKGINSNEITASKFTSEITPISSILELSETKFERKEDGTPIAAITVKRKGGDLDATVGATIFIVNNSATSPSYGSATPIEVNFAPGETTQTVTVPLVNNVAFEGELFNLRLSNPRGKVRIGYSRYCCFIDRG